MRRFALLALLLAAPAKHGYRLLDGPMPHLAPLPAPLVATPSLAPVPDPDAEPPPDRTPGGPRLLPALTNRSSVGGAAGDGYSPGSSYSPQLERRHGEPGTNIGNLLAPGLQLRVPLQ